MAYGNYYQGYQPYQYQTPLPYQGAGQQTVPASPQIQQAQMQPQIQNGGFVSVRSIEEAFNWPVAPGNSITFKDENAPYVYTKTKGFSPLEQPIFEKYRLVKEEEPRQQDNPEPHKDVFDYGQQINLLWEEINALKGQINSPVAKEEKPARKAVKKEAEPDAKHDE